jgi:hypothetical protein
LPSSRRVDAGRFAIVRLLLAPACAFLTLRFAAWTCLVVAIVASFRFTACSHRDAD